MPQLDAHCPGSAADGCRCPQHHLGLMANAVDPAAFEACLKPLRPTTLRVVTAGTSQAPACDGTMKCGCEPCVAERQALVHRGGKGAGARQPWEPRPSRHPRAA